VLERADEIQEDTQQERFRTQGQSGTHYRQGEWNWARNCWGVDRRRRRYRHRSSRLRLKSPLGTPLFAAKNGSVNGLVLKSMEPPASAALMSPGLAKKIVSTSNPASCCAAISSF
jgi:hypothetical protein